MAVLDVLRIDSCYGRSLIIHDLSLQVNAGECVALLGRKGSGRSTILKTIAGMVRPTHGEIRLADTVISHHEPREIAASGLAYVAEDRHVFRELTVEENLDVGKRQPIEGRPGWTVEQLFALFPELADIRDQRADRQPMDIQSLVMIARALLSQPLALLLDEPTLDLSESEIERLAGVFGALRTAGLGILFSETDLSFAWKVADRAYVIERGTVLRSGRMADLAQDEEIRRDFMPA